LLPPGIFDLRPTYRLDRGRQTVFKRINWSYFFGSYSPGVTGGEKRVTSFNGSGPSARI
jgi:hypothetical protein